MRRTRNITANAGLALLAMLLASCGASEDSTVNVVAIGDPGTPFASGSRLPAAAQLLRGATVEGLVSLDEQGRILPGLADRWIVTDGGKSYIFRLREGKWPDGSPITAESARNALRETMAVLRGTSLALDLAAVRETRVMAARVIEIRLAGPQPDLLLLLAQPELGLARKGRGAGPMSLKREDYLAMLAPFAPEKRGMQAEEGWKDRVRKMRLTALPARKAIDRFAEGRISVVLGGRIEHFPLIGDAGISGGAIQLDPVTGLFGLMFLHEDGFLGQAANREAIAMAIDRERLIEGFSVGGWQPTTRIVAPGVDGETASIGERWSGQPIARRKELAAGVVTRWRKGDSGPVRLRIAMPDGPGADRIFARLAADLGEAGLEAKRVREQAPADLRLVDTVARYPRPTWFLNQLSCTALRGPCSAKADQRVAEAMLEKDPASRAALLAEAEAELIASQVYVPFGPPIRWSLVSGDVTGFAANRLGYHPLMPMALRPK